MAKRLSPLPGAVRPAALIGPCGGAPEEGATVPVRLTLVDPQARKIRFDHDR
ncbi:hypothetical protein [Rhodococcus sp. NPDC047139]|uniref:hypothetical protein n=1 Tax=Rhodococcus sp. NPDC047139 TaxID=3155141 RepID=UPI0033EB4BAA